MLCCFSFIVCYLLNMVMMMRKMMSDLFQRSREGLRDLHFSNS